MGAWEGPDFGLQLELPTRRFALEDTGSLLPGHYTLADAWGFESQAWATLQVSGNFMYVLTLVVLDLQHTILYRAIHALMCLLFYTPLCFTVPPLLRYFTIPHGVLKQDRI